MRGAVSAFAAVAAGIVAALLVEGRREEPRPAPGPRRLTVAFSGDDEGRLEPCGCSPSMLGGLSRRPARLAASAEPGVPMVRIAGGRLGEGDSEYDVRKLDVILSALDTMEYRLLPWVHGIGRIRVTAAGVEVEVAPFGHAGLDERSARSILTGTGPLVILVLPGGDAPTARRVAGELGRPVLVLHAGGSTDPRDGDAVPGRVAFAPFPAHGKYVGFAHLAGDGAEAVWTVEYKAVLHEFPEDPAIVALKADFLAEMRRGNFLARFSNDARFAVTDAPPSDDRFVGNEACATCHADASRSWTESRHAKAMSSLRATGDDADPGCTNCHVVGYGTGRGFIDDKTTPRLADVGCESCHGARGRHVDARRAGTMDTRRPSAGESSCLRCHDGEHDPDFEFATRWPRIAHK
jgi:hypothetical protein